MTLHRPRFVGTLVGLEIEYFVVDAATLVPRATAEVLAGFADFGIEGSPLKPEIGAEQLEVATPPFATIEELASWSIDVHVELSDRLAEEGACLLPLALYDEHPLSLRDDERVEELAAAFGPSLARHAPVVAADQVNIGAPDDRSAMVTLEVLRRDLPELMALSVASPLRDGRSNGIASNRMNVVEATASANPSIVGIPERLRSIDEHAAAVAALPIFQRPNAYYKWIRPMPHRGVAAEVRCLDKQPTLSRTLAFAALCLGLARLGADGDVLHDEVDETGLADRFASARSEGLRPEHVPLARRLIDRAAEGLERDDRPFLEPLRADVERAATPATDLAMRAAAVGVEAAYREAVTGLDADVRSGSASRI